MTKLLSILILYPQGYVATAESVGNKPKIVVKEQETPN